MTERVEVTLCERSKPSDESRFTVKHLPIPGGVRTGVYERVFVSKSGVLNILHTTNAIEMTVSPEAQRELGSKVH